MTTLVSRIAFTDTAPTDRPRRERSGLDRRTSRGRQAGEEFSNVIPAPPCVRNRSHQAGTGSASHRNDDLFTLFDSADQLRRVLPQLTQTNCRHTTGSTSATGRHSAFAVRRSLDFGVDSTTPTPLGGLVPILSDPAANLPNVGMTSSVPRYRRLQQEAPEWSLLGPHRGLDRRGDSGTFPLSGGFVPRPN